MGPPPRTLLREDTPLWSQRAERRVGPFPRSPRPLSQSPPRLGSRGFLEWAAHLGTDAPLSPEHLEELSQTCYSETGVNSWCRAGLDQAECRRLIVRVRRRLQDGVVCVSDQLRIPVLQLPTDERLGVSLNRLSPWLVIAEEARRRATPVPTRRDTPDFDRDTFSVFALPRAGAGAEDLNAPIPLPLGTVADLQAALAGFADVHQALAGTTFDPAVSPYFEVLGERVSEMVRRSLTAAPWFHALRELLSGEFDADVSLAAVARWVSRRCRERSLTPAQAAALSPDDALGWRHGRPRPSWDAATLTLTVGDWTKRYKQNAKNQIRVLATFHAAGWPDEIVNPVANASVNVTVRDLVHSLGEGAPVTFATNQNGTGLRWSTPPV